MQGGPIMVIHNIIGEWKTREDRPDIVKSVEGR